MLSSLKISLTAHFSSVYLSPLPLHRNAMSDCSYGQPCVLWNHLLYNHCFHILCDQPSEDLMEQAPWVGIRGPQMLRILCKLVYVLFSGKEVMALTQISMG